MRTYVRYNKDRDRKVGKILKDNPYFLCIDLKSFYASVECVVRGLDPMKTNLVVADPDRTEKTICLAVTPPMKKLGVSSRCRVFEIPKSIEYIMAPPRMGLYLDYSARIYSIYLKYFHEDDIHVYSVDEAFMDASNYTRIYGTDVKKLAQTIVDDIYETTGITAACGIGTNLYLCKVALDITAKHSPDNIGILTEETYRKTLWEHRPLTDFWRVGRGTVKRLDKYGIYTMKQIAQAPEELIYKAFGIDGELLIDHAWGRESATINDIKSYVPKAHSITSGQVLFCEYTYEKARLILHEMTEGLCLDLIQKRKVTDSVGLYVGYTNRLGMPPARGSASLPFHTCSTKLIQEEMDRLYDKIVQPECLIKRISISFNRLLDEEEEGYDLFTDTNELKKEKTITRTVLDIKDKFGKNAIFKAMNLEEESTALERNKQIGGHKA
ncbi:MAG: DNA repair protein [Firmicutes bacterium]|nr:DNA repair protein [Bacillota bacterium]